MADDGDLLTYPAKNLIAILEEQLSISFLTGDVEHSRDLRLIPSVRDLVRLLIGFAKDMEGANPVHIKQVADWLKVSEDQIPGYVERITMLQRADLQQELMVRGLTHSRGVMSMPSVASPEIQEFVLSGSKAFTIGCHYPKILILTVKAAVCVLVFGRFELDTIGGRTTHTVGFTVSGTLSDTCNHECCICGPQSYHDTHFSAGPMKIVIYHVAGAGNPFHSCRSLALSDRISPDFMIVIETPLHGGRAHYMRSCFGLDQAQAVEPVNCHGGQWLLSRSGNVHFEVFRKENQFITGAISHVRRKPVLSGAISTIV